MRFIAEMHCGGKRLAPDRFRVHKRGRDSYQEVIREVSEGVSVSVDEAEFFGGEPVLAVRCVIGDPHYVDQVLHALEIAGVVPSEVGHLLACDDEHHVLYPMRQKQRLVATLVSFFHDTKLVHAFACVAISTDRSFDQLQLATCVAPRSRNAVRVARHFAWGAEAPHVGES
jgi:hypothetical protein